MCAERSIGTQTDSLCGIPTLEEQELAHRTKRLRVLSPKECLDMKKDAWFVASTRAKTQAVEAQTTGKVSVPSQTGDAELYFLHYTKYLDQQLALLARN